jgi:Nucleotidyltransferase domain
MPVRSSTSSPLKWPDAAAVLVAARAWAAGQRSRRPALVRLGVFGSYASGNAGVGSDLDLVAVVREATEPFERRAAAWDLTTLPVPAEILVYTQAEWDALLARGGRFADMMRTVTIWLVE